MCLAIWCEIILVISQSSQNAALALLNHKYDFRLRLCDTKCNYPCQNKGTFNSVQNIIDPVLRLFIICWRFPKWPPVFYFTSIWLVTLNESWNLIGCFALVWISLNITFVPTEFWNSFNAQVMARCHVISQTTQVCPLQWLWMIDDVGHMSDVKYHLCIIINCFNSFNIPRPRWFVIFHFLTTSRSMKHSRLSISYMKRRSQTCDYN